MQKNKVALLNRLQREKEDIEKNYSDQLILNVVDQEKLIWHITFTGAEGSLY